jgi:hypothetical protein
MNLCEQGADQLISGILLVPLGVGPNAAQRFVSTLGGVALSRVRYDAPADAAHAGGPTSRPSRFQMIANAAISSMIVRQVLSFIR